jgi:phage terminase large subunit-like protein
LTISPPDVLLGAQTPTLCSVPSLRISSAGRETVELAATAGLMLDPWQQVVLDGALGERNGGFWSAFEVALVLPRQNGKNSILEAREIAGLFLFGEELILHSAHEFKTGQEAFLRVRGLIEGSEAMSRRVDKVRTAHGDEGIELKPLPTVISGARGKQITRSKRQRLRFVARTSGSGRGFSGDVVILDEAFNLPESVISALLPTMSARPNPQLWYTSSAVDQEIHPHGVALARVRERGLRGDDPSLAYFEWSADEDAHRGAPRAVATDPAQWAAANPGMGYRVSADHIAREQRSMGSKSFQVERLGIGDWPATDDALKPVIDPEIWANLVHSGSKAGKFVVFAPDGNPERTSASIAAVGTRDDDLAHVEIIDRRPGTGWVAARLAELAQQWKPAAIVVDPSGPGGSWLAALQDAGIEPLLISGREMAQACGGFYEAVTEKGSIRHLDQLELRDALAGAQTRPLGDAWAWARRTSQVDISPLVAVTLAHYGWVTTQGKQRTSAYDEGDLQVV